MKLLLLMLTIIPILSFKSFFKKYNNFILKSQNNDNNDNNDNKMPKILNIDFEDLVNNMDKEMLKNFNGTIPRAPQIEEDHRSRASEYPTGFDRENIGHFKG